MIGVTVGVGAPYAELAALAADCFSACTGLPVRVLGAREFAKSGLPHPAALRLDCFEFTNVDSVVYFDADWLNLKPWNPRNFSDGRLYAARDFTNLNEWPRQQYEFDSPRFNEIIEVAASACCDEELRTDYIRDVGAFMKCPTLPSYWINTGLLVLNRDMHSNVLMRARSLYLGEVGHHPKYFEQPAFNAALHPELHLLSLLPRSFNVLAGRPTRWPKQVIGLHVKVKNHEEFVRQVISGDIRSVNHVRDYFLW